MTIPSSSALLAPAALLSTSAQWSIVDVRSPGEYARGQIPGSRNIPLFFDEDRAAVGLTYRQQGKREATLLGLSLVGPRMRQLSEALLEAAEAAPLLLTCWRGGMRSASVAWLASQLELPVVRLEGGYKGFRRAVLAQFEQPYRICLLGGETGAGKTECLQYLQEAGASMIDLEALAGHKGSSFGALGEGEQSDQQTFENRLGLALAQLPQDAMLWLESESQRIGKLILPPAFWEQMKIAPQVRLDVPLELRVARLLDEYGRHEPALLCDAISRIEERLGGLHTRTALAAVEAGDLRGCCTLLLREYYDRMYMRSLKRRTHVRSVTWEGGEVDSLVARLQEAAALSFQDLDLQDASEKALEG